MVVEVLNISIVLIFVIDVFYWTMIFNSYKIYIAVC